MSTISARADAAGLPRPMSKEERRVIFASSLGTVFEWYDFYLYGSLAAIIARHFFSGVNETAAFIFAAFCEEFGLAGVLVLLVGFTFLIFRGLMIAAEAPTVFTRLLAGAVTLSFFTYAFVNMGMVSGILPVVGVPLPFVSYGGTAMVSLGLGLGILMSVAKSRRLVQS